MTRLRDGFGGPGGGAAEVVPIEDVLPAWGCSVFDLQTKLRHETVVRARDLAAATRRAIDEITRRYAVEGSDFVVYHAVPLEPVR